MFAASAIPFADLECCQRGEGLRCASLPQFFVSSSVAHALRSHVADIPDQYASSELRIMPVAQYGLHLLDGGIVEVFDPAKSIACALGLSPVHGQSQFSDGDTHGPHAPQTQRKQTAAGISVDLQIITPAARLANQSRDTQRLQQPTIRTHACAAHAEPLGEVIDAEGGARDD
jgi:hypothetical protein